MFLNVHIICKLFKYLQDLRKNLYHAYKYLVKHNGQHTNNVDN